MPIQSPYRYGPDEDEMQRRRPNGAMTEPMMDSAPQAPAAPPAPRDPYNATPVDQEPDTRDQSPEPSTQQRAGAPDETRARPQAPAQTFTEMQEAGRARPPMPPQMLPGATPAPMPTPTPGAVPESLAALPMAPPPITETVENMGGGVGDPVVETLGLIPYAGDPIVETVENMGGGSSDALIPYTGDPIIEYMPDYEPTSNRPESSLDILNTLMTGVNQDSPLFDATEAAALDQLNSSSPYDSDAVRAEYDWLAGNIDDDFAMQQRGLDESMARRGLFGSAGKDFHSGRLADLNVGRRSAKTSLAQDLANKFATTAGDYRSNAINQAQSVAGQDTGTSLQFLRELMGFGQQGFENDMDVARFNHGQNMDYQQLLQMMLAAGYGV